MEIVIDVLAILVAVFQAVLLVVCYLVSAHLVSTATAAVRHKKWFLEVGASPKVRKTGWRVKLFRLPRYGQPEWDIFWDAVAHESKRMVDFALKYPRRLERRRMFRPRGQTHGWTAYPEFSEKDFLRAAWHWRRWRMSKELAKQAEREFAEEDPEQVKLGYFVSEYFLDLYEQDKAIDYMYRFGALMKFHMDHLEALCATPEKIAQINHGKRTAGTIRFNPAFLKFVLGGFEDPLLPGHAATHPLADQYGNFMYEDTLAAFRAWSAERNKRRARSSHGEPAQESAAVAS